MFLKDRVQISMAKRSGNVLLRSDLAELGGSTQLSAALRTLVREGKLVKLGSGIYAKAFIGADGRVRLMSPEQQVAKEVFERLGVDARIVQVDAGDSETLYVLDTSKRRVSRHLKLDAGRVVTKRDRTVGPATGMPRLIADLDELPQTGVGDFVRRLAEANQVVYKRTRLDDWAEEVNVRSVQRLPNRGLSSQR
jgi:hypothetical protein